MTNDTIWHVLDDDTLKENIRKRPNMFIGGTGPVGLESMILQVMDGLLLLSVEPTSAEFFIELSERQLSFAFSSPSGLLLNKQAENHYGSFYQFLSIVNALTKQLGLSIEKEGKRTIRIYQNGQLEQTVSLSAAEENQKIELAFTPQEEVFGNQPISYFRLFNRCQQLAMLTSGLKISLTDGKNQKNFFHYTDGLVDYIFQKDERITRGSTPLEIHTKNEEVVIDAVISKNGATSVKDSFVNGLFLTGGGTHLDGFIQGTVDAINQFLEETSRLQYLTRENFSDRFDLVLSIQVKRPRYTGVFKQKIRNPELYKIVREAVCIEVARFLKRHPSWYSS